jgi:hypothetical protein
MKKDEELDRRGFLKKAIYTTPKLVILGGVVTTNSLKAGAFDDLLGGGDDDGDSGDDGGSNSGNGWGNGSGWGGGNGWGGGGGGIFPWS